MSLSTVLGEGYRLDGCQPPDGFEQERREVLHQLERAVEPEMWWRTDEEIAETIRQLGRPATKTMAIVHVNENPHSSSTTLLTPERSAQSSDQ